jgi:hypothetical protein
VFSAERPTTMRRLIRIPIIHSVVEFGSLAESVRANYAKILDEASWQRRERAIEELWRHIRDKVLALPLDYRRVRIYQDGLPVCGFEEKIVREIARAGSPNHQLILELMARGTALEGSEDPQLLMEEYETQKRKLEKGSAADQAGQESARSDELLAARDRFIAARIEETLQEGETGLLFLGALHRFDELRSSDIRVETLD